MKTIREIFIYFKDWLKIFTLFLKSYKYEKTQIVYLQMQLAQYKHLAENNKIPRAKRSRFAFKQFAVLVSKILPNWKKISYNFTPATVIRWQRKSFKAHWKKISKKTGRPPISKEMIKLIKKISKENHILSPEKIHEQLLLKNIKKPPAPNTIAKYIPENRKDPSKKQIQSWKTFLKNHHPDIWATDFFTVPTINNKVLYVLVIIEHKTRKILHIGVTYSPNAKWTIQQFKNATPYETAPKYLIHDNDPVFRSKDFQSFLKSSKIKSKRTAYRSPWQNAYAERVIGTLRRELTNHLIIINQIHLSKLMREYVKKYYNTHRTHQGLNGKTPIPAPYYPVTTAENTKLKATPVLNGLYHTYEKVA